MYYRYEIVIENKRYGILTGLDEIGLNDKLIDELTEYFDKYLPVPNFYYTKGKNAKKDVYAYFTEYGNEKFEKYLNKIIDVAKKHNFEIIRLVQNKVGTRRLIYEDKYQVLIKNK